MTVTAENKNKSELYLAKKEKLVFFNKRRLTMNEVFPNTKKQKQQHNVIGYFCL